MDAGSLPFLNTFVAICELGTLTAAAQRLHRTQPTITYQLRQLEQAIGAPLFVRGRRRMIPTPLGERLHRLAAGFARDVRLAAAGPAERERLAIASVSGFGRYVVVPQLMKMRPLPYLSLHFPTADEVGRRVRDGEAHAGFVHRPLDLPGITLEPIYIESFALIAPASWQARLKRPADFKDMPVVTYDEGDYLLGRWLGDRFGRRSPAWHSAAHCEELEEVLTLVAAGAGVAVVPHFIVGRDPRIRMIVWGRPPVLNTVYVARRDGAADSPALSRLLESLAHASPGPIRG